MDRCDTTLATDLIVFAHLRLKTLYACKYTVGGLTLRGDWSSDRTVLAHQETPLLY